jgi:hypothetical protein
MNLLRIEVSYTFSALAQPGYLAPLIENRDIVMQMGIHYYLTPRTLRICEGAPFQPEKPYGKPMTFTTQLPICSDSSNKSHSSSENSEKVSPPS